MLPRRIFSKSSGAEATGLEAGLVRRQTVLGRLAAVCCLGAALALGDGLIAGAGDAARPIALTAGDTVRLTGPLPAGVTSPNELTGITDAPGLSFRATGLFADFWLGRPMWRGRLRAEARAAPGTTVLTLTGPTGQAQRLPVRIFADQAALDAAAPSRVRRLTGRSPFGVAAFLFGWAVLAGLGVARTGHRLEAVWREQGMAAVYRTRTTARGQRIAFGLGSDQGVHPGATVCIRAADGRPLATATVIRCTAGDAVALVSEGHTVRPWSRVRYAPTGTADRDAVNRT